jgi:uncharacterized membrane protein
VSPVVTPAPLRTARDRLHQTLWFEAGGLALVAPAYAWATGSSASDSLGLLVALSVLVMAWAALYNTLFDRWEWQRHRCVASSRPARLRTLHAIGLEASVVLLSCPLIMAFTGLGFWPALGLDLALSAVYTAYGWAFHWGYDRLRPVQG